MSLIRNAEHGSGMPVNLCMSQAIESAKSAPSISFLCFGERSEPPPQAASIWNHIPNSLQIADIFRMGSKEPLTVEPAVATTASGILPAFSAYSIFSFSSFVSIEPFSSTPTLMTLL